MIKKTQGILFQTSFHEIYKIDSCKNTFKFSVKYNQSDCNCIFGLFNFVQNFKIKKAEFKKKIAQTFFKTKERRKKQLRQVVIQLMRMQKLMNLQVILEYTLDNSIIVTNLKRMLECVCCYYILIVYHNFF